MTKKSENILINVGANLVIIAVLLTILFGSLAGAVAAGGKTPAIYHGNVAEPRVSFMVNVYWGEQYIEEMLDVFDTFGFKTTFFIGGVWASRNHDVVKMIADRGHELANHGYLHKDHKNLNLQQNQHEITLTERLIMEITGQKTTLFAPPSGSIGNNMFAAAETLNYKVIMWTKDTIDWRDKCDVTVLKRATTGIQSGDFILAHPSAHTLKALPRILQFYHENGFRAVTVSENLSPSNK
jgi:peptidoglycan/xylan/chitin deacetylase (PgdA/CDA1 family)